MITPREYWTKNISELQEKPYNYMIVRTEHFPYTKDKDQLERGVEVIELCTSLKILNEAYQKTGIDKTFEFKILFEVLEAVYSNNTFTDEQLERLYDFDKRLDDVYHGMKYLSPGIAENLYLDCEIKLSLFGFDFEKQSEFNRLDEHEYGDAIELHYEKERMLHEGKITLQEMKKDILDHFREKFEEVKNKARLKCA